MKIAITRVRWVVLAHDRAVFENVEKWSALRRSNLALGRNTDVVVD